MQLSRYEEAIAHYKEGLMLEPDYAQGYFNLGNAQMETGQLNQAEYSYRQAITLKPNYIEAYINLGNILQSRGKLEQAETTLRGAIVINPSSSEVHYNLGNILHKLNKLEDAEVCYRKSISLDPEYFEPQNNLGNLLAEMGRFGESEAILTQLITLNSDSSEAYFNLGNTLKNLDRLEESAQCLREALAIKPRYSDARNNLAVILKQLGQYQEAIKHFDLINHPDALAQVLECHYFDANYAAFDQRLNLIAASENTNLRVAAVSAFVAHQRDKQDIYQFCQQPLDFVMTSNLSEYDPHSIELVNNILEESSGYKLAWESRTTKFGFQGPNDLFQNPSEDVFKLEKIVRQAIADYYAKYRNQSNILIESWPTSYKLTAWYNRLLKNGFQMAHLHSGGWISGVIYLKTTAPSNNNEGAIEFSLHGYDYPIINANYPKQLFQPVTGDIVLFPSSLFHRTLPFTTNAERCVIAFDLVAL
jgi:tetratricopeptide (TPR) repeat protein